MKYTPHRPQDIESMLRAIGVGSVEELFKDIPQILREKASEAFEALPSPSSEQSVMGYMDALADQNYDLFEVLSFMGAGAYHHHVPPVVDVIASRGEFYTAYTPYQPEVSQGSLHVSFEWQTYIARLTGMEVANASMYDAASAAAEAVYMAMRILKKDSGKVVVAGSLHPDVADVIRTYASARDVDVVSIPWDEGSGRLDLTTLTQELKSGESISVVVQSPNFFGVIENIGQIAELVHGAGALLIVAVLEPHSLGLIVPPGEMGADVVVGDVLGFGNYPAFGGPGAGFFATRRKYIRQMPGRIVGETTDADGVRGYVLTLQTREQHIRRARATSNITSNHFLMALRSTVYMALLGGTGLKKLARVNYKIAHYAFNRLLEIGLRPVFSGPFFNEFAIALPDDMDADAVWRTLAEEGIYPGVPLSRWYDGMDNVLLMNFTELHGKEDIEHLVYHLGEVLGK